MLHPLTYSLSAAIAASSFHLTANASPEDNLALFAQAQTVPEIIVDTIPIEDPTSPPPEAEDIVVETDSPPSNDPRFTCEYNNGQYTVMYNPVTQPDQSYPWAIPQQMGSNWSPEKRCRAISQRLETYRPDGLLELQTRMLNNESIVCVTTETDPSCRIVFTVPRGQDPILTRDRVFENLASANTGEQTWGVTTFTHNFSLRDLLRGNTSRNANNSINLRPFLDPADGGTGRELRSTSSQLNPDLFR